MTVMVGHVAPGPVLPQKRTVPDQMVSLAGVDRLRFEVVDIPAALRNVGITLDDIDTRCRRALRATDIALDKEEQDQVLRLKLYAMTEENVRDAMAYVVTLRFTQPVSVDRVGRTLAVPTYAQVAGGLEIRENLLRALKAAVDTMIDDFIKGVLDGSKVIDNTSTQTDDGDECAKKMRFRAAVSSLAPPPNSRCCSSTTGAADAQWVPRIVKQVSPEAVSRPAIEVCHCGDKLPACPPSGQACQYANARPARVQRPRTRAACSLCAPPVP